MSQRALREELSCEVFPLGVLQACSTEFLCKPFTKSTRFCSVSGTRFTPISFAKRCSSDSVVLPSHAPWTNLASAPPCLIPSRIFSTRGHVYTEQSYLRELHHLLLVRFPKTIFERCLLVAFYVAPFQQPSSVSRPWGVTSIERRVSNSSRKHRI